MISLAEKEGLERVKDPGDPGGPLIGISWNVDFYQHCNHPFVGVPKFGPQVAMVQWDNLKLVILSIYESILSVVNVMHLGKHLLCLVSMMGLGQ